MKISKFSLILILGLFFSHSSLKAQNSNPILLKEISKIGFTEDDTPEYKFSSTHEGNLIYSGKCKSSTKKAKIGENIINLDSLINGIYFDCKIKLKDVFGKFSNELSISRFTINKAAENNNSSGSSGGSGVGILGALAGALNGGKGGAPDCNETGIPKCPSETQKISPQQCKKRGEAFKITQQSFKTHTDKFQKDVVQTIHKDNQANPSCSIRYSTKQLHHFDRCIKDVKEGFLTDCSGATKSGMLIPLAQYAFHNDTLSEKIKNFFLMPTVSAAASSPIVTRQNFMNTYHKISKIGKRLNRINRSQMKTIVDQNTAGKRLSLFTSNKEQELNMRRTIQQPLQQEAINLLRQQNSGKTSLIPKPIRCTPPKCNKQPETFKPKDLIKLIALLKSEGSGGGGTCISNEHAILKPKTTIANGEIIKVDTETQIVSFDLKNEAICSIELDKLKVSLVGPLITTSEKIKIKLYYKINNQEKEVDGIEIKPQEQDKEFDLKKLILPGNSELEFNISIQSPPKFKNKNFYLEIKASKNIDVWDGEIPRTDPYSIKSSSFIIQE